MTPGDYRREYAAFCAALARALYDHRTGRTPAPQLAPLQDRYADLWTPTQLASLERARQDTPAQFETERTALERLVNAARLGYVSAQTRAVADELRRCETSAVIDWMGTRTAAAVVPELLAREPDAARRRELAARWRDALAACDDLRAALRAERDEAAAALGLSSYNALLHDAARADETQLTTTAGALLTRTDDVYRARLHDWAARQLPPQHARAPAHADALFFARLAQHDELCPVAALPTAYAAALAGFGIRVERQTNLRINWHAPGELGADAACFAVEPPADVRLVVSASGGAQLYRRLFYAAGCAQQLAWVSRETAARYPEFVRGPDATTRAAYGFLFRDLLHDPAWLAELRGLKPSVARAVAHDYALVALYEARRDCALVLHNLTLAAAPDPRAESRAAEYAARLTDATGFAHDPALHLWTSLTPAGDGGSCDAAGAGALGVVEDAAAAGADACAPGSALRARLCAAALGEYLRTRHGRRWWAARAAGDELIDLWNTGARYTVEELAALAGAGPLDVDLLARAFNE
jgi:hypothetical protein